MRIFLFAGFKAVDRVKQPFFLIHGTGGRFSWSFSGDFAGFLDIDALVDIVGALVLDLFKALDLEI